MNLYWLSLNLNGAFVLPFLSMPLALILIQKIFQTAPGPIYNRYLGMSAGVHLLFGMLLSAGLAYA
jgi:1,4-dihydroxy-2-naphthoate octaprenyltransferase